MTTYHKPLSIIAKCASCSIKTNLFVCSHCDEVICQICVDKHQSNLHETLKEHWKLCQTKFFNICLLSDTYEKDVTDFESEIDQIRVMIDERRTDLVHLIETEKNILLNKIDEYLRLNRPETKHADIQQLFDSMNQRLNSVFQDPNTSVNSDDFLLEIKHLNMLIYNREKQMQTNLLKYPYLTPSKPMSISDIFGELQWNSKPMSNHILIKPLVISGRSVNPMINGHVSTETTDKSQKKPTVIPEDTTSLPIAKRQKQWTLDATGVPHFLAVLSKKSHLLFSCDKFGCIDLYQLDNDNPKRIPRRLRQFELFPGNSSTKQSQVIETFTVYTPFIVIAAHLTEQTDTSSIYFFDHRGSQQGETCLQKFPVRQLSADVGMRYLWGVDRHQHTIYYTQLPMNLMQISEFIKRREDFLKFNRDFEPIRIAQNQNCIAIVERNSQSAHIFDKQTKKQTNEIENLLRTKGIFRLWNALLRNDNSMVLKLDEDLPPNSRPPSINHLILELDFKGEPISQIERTSVFGFAIGPNGEILLGCKKHQQNGLIECYI